MKYSHSVRILCVSNPHRCCPAKMLVYICLFLSTTAMAWNAGKFTLSRRTQAVQSKPSREYYAMRRMVHRRTAHVGQIRKIARFALDVCSCFYNVSIAHEAARLCERQKEEQEPERNIHIYMEHI